MSCDHVHFKEIISFIFCTPGPWRHHEDHRVEKWTLLSDRKEKSSCTGDCLRAQIRCLVKLHPSMRVREKILPWPGPLSHGGNFSFQKLVSWLPSRHYAHYVSSLCSVLSDHPMWLPPPLAPTYTHTRSLMGSPEDNAMAVLGVKFYVLLGERVRRTLKQVESTAWGCKSSRVTTEEGKNPSKHKLCKYLHKHGDSRIVEKSHSAAIQD